MDSKRRKDGLTHRELASAFDEASRAEKPSASKPARVIIDTDPGVDDALALLLAMRSPELKIEGITPVAGNVPLDRTLPNALRMVEIAGRTDIPVAAGAAAPLMRRLVTAEFDNGNNGLAGAEFPEPTLRPIAEPAPEFISRIVRAHPGEVTLITVGPMTNVGAALRADPALAKMVRGLTFMGGSLSGGNITPAAEFNIFVDPEAARIVFQSGIPLTMVGLDVTRQTLLTEEHLRALEGHSNAVSQAAAKIARHILENNRRQGFAVGQHMHDPLAVAAIIDPSLLKLEKYYVDVETSGELTAGMTLGYSPYAGDLRRLPGMEHLALDMLIRGAPLSLGHTDSSPNLRDHWVPNTEVAVQVDAQRFFDLFIGRLSGKA
jgi:inosine-uridine nucleoside N-ribohydrolase